MHWISNPTPWGLLYLFLQNWSVFTIALELTLSKIRDERKPRHRLASLGNPKEKCSLLFGFARARFFLKKERVFFFRGSALQVFEQVAGRNAELGRRGRRGLGGRNPAPSSCLTKSLYFDKVAVWTGKAKEIKG